MNFQAVKNELTKCDREAIHNIATVQPFGALIEMNADWVIAHRSLNCADILGLEDLPEVGTHLGQVFTQVAIQTLQERMSRLERSDTVERMFGLQLVNGGALMDCALHLGRDRIVLEIEISQCEGRHDHLVEVAPLLAELSVFEDLERMCAHAAKLFRRMLGYDRVMIYRFHEDESGEVIAESHRKGLDSYLGLRYPRTDIPAQARSLFLRNRFRVIADVDAVPSPIEPSVTISGAPLDMSMSILRSSSDIHLRYLRNMGVSASLTIAIIREGRLWGLVACHHCEPRLPSYSLRTIADLLCEMFSLTIDRLLITRSETLRSKGREVHDQLMLRLASGTTLIKELPKVEEALESLLKYDGASVFFDGDYRSSGHAPTRQQFERLLPMLGSAPTSQVLATEKLSDHIPAAAEFAEAVCGALILPISRSPRDYLILWRRSLTQVLRWGGNPAKAVVPGTDRLEPRSSFAEWVETVEGKSEAWSQEDFVIAEGLRVTLLEVILRMTDEVSRERRRAQEHQELLIAELNHRVRNILNLIRSLVSQSQDDTLSVSAFASIIGGRIAALASAHDNITRENWAPAPLSALFETELGAYLNEKRGRFILSGEEVLIKPEAYTVLALVVHELVTNSAKHGSLCDSSGKLHVDVAKTPAGDLEIKWSERGGPPVKPPTRRGFGSTIIERSIPFELKGEADLRFKLTGLEADFLIPARYIEQADETQNRSEPAKVLEQLSRGWQEDRTRNSAGIPKHVLVVEDSMIIALDTEENIRRLGVKSVQVESSVAGALRAIEQRMPDFAILDFNLGNESSSPVAAALAERGVRFVLATGYSEIVGQLDELGASAVLRKPYGREEIERVLIMRG